MDTGSLTGELRPRTDIAGIEIVRTVLRVRNESWPRVEFLAYLDATKASAGIVNDAELARRSGVRSSVISRWRSGEQQPGHDNLRKIAEALDVPTVNLWIVAGLASPTELDLSRQPDLTVLPPELRELVELYNDPALTEAERELLRAQARTTVLGVRAMVSERTPADQRRRVRRPA